MNDTARTEEHAAARHKRITGSRIAKIMTGGPAAWDSLSDMLHSPEPEPFYSLEKTPNMPEPMRRGLEYEPMARGDFFFRHDEYSVNQPMFCHPGEEDSYNEETGVRIYEGVEADKDLWEWIGVSPDAMLMYIGNLPFNDVAADGVLLIPADAGLELKVPSMEKHLEWAKAGIVPREHLPQCALSLLVTGADHWWFCSFCPEIEGDERFFEVKLEREDVYLAHMKVKIRAFLEGHKAHQVFAQPAPVQEAIPATNFPVVNFGINDKAIETLIKQYDNTEEPTTSSSYAVVKAAQVDMMRRRTGVEKAYKKATEKAQEYILGVRNEKKRLIAKMEPTETKLKGFRTAWEDEQQRKKEEAEAKEAARIATILGAIEWMNVGALNALQGLNSDLIRTEIETYKLNEVSEARFEEHFTAAQNAHTVLITKAEKYLQLVFDQEQDDARVAQEQKELRERNEQLEAENKARLDREATEQKERDRVKAIDDQLNWIRASVMEAMEGTIGQAKGIRRKLNNLCSDFKFDEKQTEARTLVEKTIELVEKIIVDKQHELDEIEKVQREERELADEMDALESPLVNEVEAAIHREEELESPVIDFDEGEKQEVVFPDVIYIQVNDIPNEGGFWCEDERLGDSCRYVKAPLEQS